MIYMINLRFGKGVEEKNTLSISFKEIVKMTKTLLLLSLLTWVKGENPQSFSR